MKRKVAILFLSLMLGCAENAVPVPAPSPAPTAAPRGTVILDFGHGGFDGGAVGIDTGVVEADLNLAVGLLTEAALIERGYTVILTRPDENALADTKNADMHARGEILSQPADCTVSIHMNKFKNRAVKGPMAFYQAGAEKGQRLAACVIRAITAALGLPDRQANPANNFVTRIPTAPSVLVECGFLSNAEDEKNLQDPAYQERLAEAIAEGVEAFLAE